MIEWVGSIVYIMKKLPTELWILIAMIVGPLFFIQALHIHVHSDFCKTESEWNDIQRERGE